MGKSYHFTHVSDSEDCGVIFYDRKTGREVLRVPFTKDARIGRVNHLRLDLEDSLGKNALGEMLYQFWDGERRLADRRGRAFFAAKKYGEEKSPEDLYTILDVPAFDWKGTGNPRVPYSDALIYCLHARGFTKHASSGVKYRGTFAGVTEKIPYLKELGVTTVEFQPVCEYVEKPSANKNVAGGNDSFKTEGPRLNYWGYVQAFYYAPKEAYAAKDPVTECKEMIRSLHEAGMEAVFQFYFPKEFNPMEIPEILRFWVEEYHVDGFHLIGEDLPSEWIAMDPALSDTKIWYYQFDCEQIYGKRGIPNRKNLGLLRDDFMYEGRRFLKGDENLIPAIAYQLRTVPVTMAKINYLSTYWGFTMMDMVSYDFKHNEPNGEENHDGTDYNCSWNCGEEGVSRKKKILSLRMTQLKNAFCLLFFAQGTPRIFMGDEFGNSQKGNNNPYCQDNEVTWLNWKLKDKNQELLEFFKTLTELRRANPVLRPGEEAKGMDSISCGYPDFSLHGETAWRPQFENYSRQLGALYCGLYREKDLGITPWQYRTKGKTTQNEFLYLGMNMHWENHKLGLPRLPKGKKWELAFETSENGASREAIQDAVTLAPKTMALYFSKDVGISEEKQETGEKERLDGELHKIS